jgi:hypothetical protein
LGVEDRTQIHQGLGKGDWIVQLLAANKYGSVMTVTTTVNNSGEEMVFGSSNNNDEDAIDTPHLDRDEKRHCVLDRCVCSLAVTATDVGNDPTLAHSH